MRQEPFVLGAVAYDPKVVTIWEGFKALVRRAGPRLRLRALLQLRAPGRGPPGGADARRVELAARVGAEPAPRRRRGTHGARGRDARHRPGSDARWCWCGGQPTCTTVAARRRARSRPGRSTRRRRRLIPLLHLAGPGSSPGATSRSAARRRWSASTATTSAASAMPSQALIAGEVDAACVIDGNHLVFAKEGTIPAGAVRVLAQTAPYDHCNMTVLDDVPPCHGRALRRAAAGDVVRRPRGAPAARARGLEGVAAGPHRGLRAARGRRRPTRILRRRRERPRPRLRCRDAAGAASTSGGLGFDARRAPARASSASRLWRPARTSSCVGGPSRPRGAPARRGAAPRATRCEAAPATAGWSERGPAPLGALERRGTGGRRRRRRAGCVAERPAPGWGLAARGAMVEAGGPTPAFASRSTATHVWAERAAARSTRRPPRRSGTRRPRSTGRAPMPDGARVEDAVVQVMTFLIENEKAALVVPGALPRRRCTRTSARCCRCSRCRSPTRRGTSRSSRGAPAAAAARSGCRASAVAPRCRRSSTSPTSRSPSFLLSVLGEGTFLSLLGSSSATRPTPSRARSRSSRAQDEARHVAFGLAHLERHVGRRARPARASGAAPSSAATTRSGHRRSQRRGVRRARAARGRDAAPDAIARGVATRSRRSSATWTTAGGPASPGSGFTAGEAEALSALHTRNFM